MMSRHLEERPAKLDHAGHSEHDTLQEIAERVSATVGADFFQAIAKHLAKALHADSVVIAEFLSEPVPRVRTVAAVTDGRRDHFDYEVEGTTASLILEGKPCQCRTGARRHLPDDRFLDRLHAEAFVGLPLTDAAGTAIGLMLAVFRQPVSSLGVPKSLLKIFTPRASAELIREQEEERLRESEQRYKAFVQTNPIAMWRIDFRQPIPTGLPEALQLEKIREYGYLAEYNQSLAALLEVDNPEAIIFCPVDELVPQSQAAYEATLQLIRSGYRFTISEVDLTNRSGRQRHHVRTAWGIVDNDRLIRIWGTTQDITDLRQSQLALENTERRILHTLEVMQLAVIILNVDGTIKYTNKYLKTLTGWEKEELNGKNWIDLLIPAEERDRVRAMTSASELRDQAHIESTLIGKEGSRWWIAWDNAVLRGTKGDIEAAVLIGRDITEQRTIEEHLRQAQKLEGIGRLAGGIAHDFNNLLTVIVGYCALLLQQNDLPDSAHGAVEQVRKAAEKGAQLTNQLLTFSRRQVQRPHVIRLSTVVVDAESMLRRLIGDDVELRTSLDSNAGCVRADPGSIHQVLMNLVLNARDAMPEGGTITIAVENRLVASPHSLSAPGVPPGEFVVLSVSDTGTGMTTDVLSHLFEPFFTTKERGKGTGMGLPMVYGIVRQTGGHIVVDSELLKGSCLRIFLPRAEPVEPPKSDDQKESEIRGGSETILVVEDHQEVRTVAARMLRGLGYTVLEAADPAYAIEVAERRPEVKLLLADMMMPGMSGSSLAKMLLKARPGLKVLLMSGHTDIPAVAESLSESGLPLLRKPFTPASLAASVRAALDSQTVRTSPGKM